MTTIGKQQPSVDVSAKKVRAGSAANKRDSDDDFIDHPFGDDDASANTSDASSDRPGGIGKHGEDNEDDDDDDLDHDVDGDNMSTERNRNDDDDDLDHLMKDDDDLDHVLDGLDDGEAPLGTLELVPSILPSASDGVVRLKAKVVFEGLDGILNGVRVMDKTNIQFDLIFDTIVQPLPGVSFIVNENEKCGVQIDVIEDKTGDLVCGNSFNELKIPPISNSAKEEPLKIGASAKDLEDASESRDKYLGLVQAVGYGSGVACIVFAVVTLTCCLLGTRRRLAREPTLEEGHTADCVANV